MGELIAPHMRYLLWANSRHSIELGCRGVPEITRPWLLDDDVTGWRWWWLCCMQDGEWDVVVDKGTLDAIFNTEDSAPQV